MFFYDPNGQLTGEYRDDATTAQPGDWLVRQEDGNGQLFEYHPRFPGQYFDKETNLHYNYFRYYEPETGRYISPDPIGLMGGMNVWEYVGQKPLSFVDRFGLDKTILFPPGDGRSIADGPRNGNWGGGKWSGRISGNGTGNALPLYSADACYMRHDLCCDSGAAKKLCDARLVRELKALPNNSRKWPVLSKLETEVDTILFLIGAILIFSP